ncbi:hypothetical protein ECP03023084_2175 [Escherichia coli P0302308.4]|nr:hypothetical protein ECP03023081_2712 [Escherichia coli P0302308.1]ENC98687.1 hypothetical protein ECP030230810_2238 [Escherichia coli P0302308.10]END03004.1 hypothetical protein ECP030230811_2305 [Escherichia coli P0302308.11]END10551.1 hypothetical protein ECP03023083_2305 [Escherichia coli P0302308.3]END13968.1 hypothetical protein ECP03023082_2313 [Escherichia coli P0302308.2]END22258.1 hypothetical protein ECP03023085_2289 [Escherichia coli P0302308.5]END26277.1 hypothetical protein E
MRYENNLKSLLEIKYYIYDIDGKNKVVGRLNQMDIQLSSIH